MTQDDAKTPGSLFDSSALLRSFKGAQGEGSAMALPMAGPTLVSLPKTELTPGDIPRFSESEWIPPQPAEVALAAVLSGESMVSEEFRLLLAKIRILGEEQPFRSIGIVSSVAGEGKTTVALGLAAALARQPGRRVLLVEADLRRPAVERYLGVPQARGVGEWLEGDDQPVALRRLVPPGFALLSAGQARFERPDLLGSRRMAGLLEAARRSFNVVVIDCPPISPVADSVLLQDMLDGFLFVVRAGQSPREAILRGVARLRPGRIRGVVFNDQRELFNRYASHGYRHYGVAR
jgi:succinoglycan biosynthesis transport protein ExoP